LIVISDTTPIISLVKANQIQLLEKLYKKVIIPEAVYIELTMNSVHAEESEKIKQCSFLVVEKVQNIQSVKLLRTVTGLDAGESEALILYEEQKADLLLMDEHKGRGVAKKMSVEHIGTVGILMLAFDKKYISAHEVEEILSILIDKNIRLSRNLCNKVLNYVGLDSKF
jgi:hypothetical protein